jgi:hypothetical protein
MLSRGITHLPANGVAPEKKSGNSGLSNLKINRGAAVVNFSSNVGKDMQKRSRSSECHKAGSSMNSCVRRKR